MSEEIKKDWKKFKEESDALEPNDSDEGINAEFDDDGHALEHLSYQELEDKLTLTEQQAHENWEKSARAMAELDNVRRRAEREVANAHRYGLEKLLNSLLPVVDSIEEALRLADLHADTAMHEGLELTMKYDVQQLNPQGERFDPQEHEAMSMQASTDVPSNTVLVVFQKGYKLNDRIIRPARVIVAKNP